MTRALILERMDQLAPFRRRLVEVPLGLDLPYWVEDPDFDIDFHVRQLALPSPGSDEQLAEQVARIVSRPLDRSRPLWELYVIEGLSGGRIAQLTKIHHATIDGASGAQMLADMLETDPTYRPSRRRGRLAVRADRPPTPSSSSSTALEYMRRPEKMVRLNVRMLRQLASSTRSGGLRAMADMVAQPLPGPLGDAAAPAAAGRQRDRHAAGPAAHAGAAHAVQPLDHAPPPLRLHVDPAWPRPRP